MMNDTTTPAGRSRGWRVLPTVAMALGVLATTAACGPDPRPTPPPGSECTPDSYENAVIERVASDEGTSRWNLTVSGKGSGPSVYLLPVTYIRQPEYWQIEVQRCGPPGVTYPQYIQPYSVTIDLTGVIGTRGVEVVGTNQTEKLDVPLPSGPWGPA
jgi:hypothetical protein